MKKLLMVLLLSLTTIFTSINAEASFVYIADNTQGLFKLNSLGTLVWSFTGHSGSVEAVDVDSDGFVYSGGVDNTVRKIDPNGSQVWSFTGHTDTVLVVDTDYDGFVYSGSRDDTVRKIDSNGNQIWSYTGHSNDISRISVDLNGNVYAVSQLELHKIDSNGNFIDSYVSTSVIQSVTTGLDGAVYIALADGKEVIKLDSSLNEIWTFSGHTANVNDVAVDVSNNVYSVSSDATVRKIDSNGNQIWSFTGHTSTVYRVDVDDSGFVYSSSFDTTNRKIDPNGNQVWIFSTSFPLDIAVAPPSPEPPEYNVELQTNTPYNDFIYQDDEVNVTTDSIITTILNDESFTVTSTAITTGAYTFNFWFDLDNMSIFSTNRNFTILDPSRDYNLIADYTLDSFNTFNLDSNLPTAQNFTFNTFTLENEVYSFNQTEFDNYQHPSDRAWEIIAPITNIGFYEFDYYYDNDGNDIYDFNHIITGSGFSPPNLTAVYSLPEEYQINLIIESGIGDIIFQHGENDPISGPFISQTIGLGDDWSATAPNNQDYQFNFWLDLEIISLFSNTQTININSTERNYYLEAIYSELVDINWDSAGGTLIPQQTVIIGSSVQPPTEPVRPGFIFDYWEDSDNNEVIYPKNISEDVTFTAIWLETFTVDFQVNGGAPVPSQTVLENETINVVTPSRFGFTFEGWYTDNVTFNNEFDFNTPIDQDDTLFAKWAFGTEDNAEQSLNVFLVDSNLDDPFAQIIIVLAFFVLLNAIIYVYSGPMIVTLILNFILTALFMVLGFIPFWIIIMIFIAIFGFALLMLFGGRSTA